MKKKFEKKAAKPKERKKDKRTNVNNVAEGRSSEDSEDEWVYSVNGASQSRDVKCQMEVGGNMVMFQIDNCSSVNLVPDKYHGAESNRQCCEGHRHFVEAQALL